MVKRRNNQNRGELRSCEWRINQVSLKSISMRMEGGGANNYRSTIQQPSLLSSSSPPPPQSSSSSSSSSSNSIPNIITITITINRIISSGSTDDCQATTSGSPRLIVELQNYAAISPWFIDVKHDYALKLVIEHCGLWFWILILQLNLYWVIDENLRLQKSWPLTKAVKISMILYIELVFSQDTNKDLKRKYFCWWKRKTKKKKKKGFWWTLIWFMLSLDWWYLNL